MPKPASNRRVLGRGSWPEVSRIGDILRTETVGGALLIGAAIVALVWANSPGFETYRQLRDFRIGPEALHLDLSLGTWAADGLLAIFFFVAGLELKREFVAGDLRDPRRAALPVIAAVCGMIAPALVYFAFVAGTPAVRGWAIPTATDIAFALAVLAVISTHLPSALRTFLLTLAVVDDLLAIVIIAVFFTSDLQVVWLFVAAAPLAVFLLLVQRRVRSWWLLLPLATIAWMCVHASGVHATVAGVLLGFAVPVLSREGRDEPALAEWFEHRFRPLSAAVAVPIFAFFASGVHVGGWDAFGDALTDPIALGVAFGLVLGKTIGVMGGTWLTTRFTRAELDPDLSWTDILGVSILAGIGFTVSLLVAALAFGAGSDREELAKVGILTGSLAAAVIASIVLRTRNRVYRRIAQIETRDLDKNQVPDVFESGE